MGPKLLSTFLTICLLAAPSLAQEPGPVIISPRTVALARYALSARFDADETDNCGGEKVTNGWSVAVEQYWERDVDLGVEMRTTGGFFDTNNGTFMAPIDGFYYLSASVRCATQACDITMRVEHQIVAGMGTDLVEIIEGQDADRDAIWASHGVATSTFLRQGDEVFLQHQSANGNDFQDGAEAGDCIYDTKFFYGQFNAWLVFATEIKDDEP